MREAHRALQNPAMFTSDHYKQAAYAVAVGIAIRVVVSIPVRLDQGTQLNLRLTYL